MTTTKTGAQRALAAGQYYCPQCERMYPDGDHCPDDGTRLVKIKAVVDPLLGRVLDGRYTIIEKLGQGGMGAVYRASQHSVGREVAIKVVNSHLVSDPDAIRRFLREAKIASRLSHPNAVAVLDFGQSDDGLFYLVMELVTGRTLDQVIKNGGMLRPDRIVRIGSQVCDALESAHALQIVHRDLKPANIMLLAQGRDHVKVLDFGLAKSVATDNAMTTMTNAGALLGTPAYMPPELALGQPCDGRADLYALGCILYLLGSGRLPFTSDSPHELIAAHAHDPAPPMTGVPPALGAVIDRLLEKDPNRRFQTATETREALEAALEGRVATPLPFDTSPSLGPFPSKPEDFAQLRDRTPAPRALSAREMHQLAASDTVAANAVTLAEAPRRRWVVPLLVVVALAGAGLGALVAMSGSDDEAAAGSSQPVDDVTAPAGAPPAVAAPPESGSQVAVEPPTTTEPPTIESAPKVQPETPVTTPPSATLDTISKTTPKVTTPKVTPPKTVKKTSPKSQTKTQPAKTQPATVKTQPVTPKSTTTTPAGKGSGALPF